jgi:hypothetical protein
MVGYTNSGYTTGEKWSASLAHPRVRDDFPSIEVHGVDARHRHQRRQDHVSLLLMFQS